MSPAHGGATSHSALGGTQKNMIIQKNLSLREIERSFSYEQQLCTRF